MQDRQDFSKKTKTTHMLVRGGKGANFQQGDASSAAAHGVLCSVYSIPISFSPKLLDN